MRWNPRPGRDASRTNLGRRARLPGVRAAYRRFGVAPCLALAAVTLVGGLAKRPSWPGRPSLVAAGTFGLLALSSGTALAALFALDTTVAAPPVGAGARAERHRLADPTTAPSVTGLAIFVASRAASPVHLLSADTSSAHTPITRALASRPASAPAQAVFAVSSTDDAVDAVPSDGNCATDLGVCTLRAAVQEARAMQRPVTVNVPPGTYAITLDGADEDAGATGDLDLGGEVTIAGDGGREATVVESAVNDRVFHVRAPATVTLRGLTVRNGKAVRAGAGILNEGGTLTVEDSDVSANTTERMADPLTGVPRYGGGICNIDGTVTVQRTLIRSNAADWGGGIGNDGNGPADVLVVDSEISDNKALGGGGIGIHGHHGIGLRVVKSVIADNWSDDLGGGIAISTGGAGNAMAIVASEVRRNYAFSSGGGVFLGTGGRTAFHMVGSTVAENNAFSGAGIRVASQGVISATIADSSVTDNTTVMASGGGMYLDAAPFASTTAGAPPVDRAF